MNSSAEIVDLLNKALDDEMTCVRRFLIYQVYQDSWGLCRTSEKMREFARGAMHGIHKLSCRIVLLEGHPELKSDAEIPAEANIRDQFDRARIELEEYRANHIAAIKKCGEEGDPVSAKILGELVGCIENEIKWLESQLILINDAGLNNYLPEQGA